MTSSGIIMSRQCAARSEPAPIPSAIARQPCYSANTMATRDKPPSGRPPPKPSIDEIVALYRRAFAEFGSRALWNIRQLDEPSVEQMLAITRQLRTEGDMDARRLAEQIEQAAHAYL